MKSVKKSYCEFFPMKYQTLFLVLAAALCACSTQPVFGVNNIVPRCTELSGLLFCGK